MSRVFVCPDSSRPSIGGLTVTASDHVFLGGESAWESRLVAIFGAKPLLSVIVLEISDRL